MTLTHLASNLKYLLLERGWSQSELGRRSGVPQSLISKILRGKVEPRQRTIKKLATAFEIAVDYLLRSPNADHSDINTNKAQVKVWLSIWAHSSQMCLAHALKNDLLRTLEGLGIEPSSLEIIALDLEYTSRLDASDLGKGPEIRIILLTPELLASFFEIVPPKNRVEFLAQTAARRSQILRLYGSPLTSSFDQASVHDIDHTYARSYFDLLSHLAGILLRDELLDLKASGHYTFFEVKHPSLPTEVRTRLIETTARLFKQGFLQRLLASGLGIDTFRLDLQPSSECKASAALVLATGDDDRTIAALRFTRTLIKETEEVAHLDDSIADELVVLRDLTSQLCKVGQPDMGLLGAWFSKLRDDHARLVPYFQQRTELDLLDRVYVQLELRRDLLGLGQAEKLERIGKPATESQEALKLAGPMTVRQVIDLDPEQHEGISQRWVILGDPGAGKTTLLRHLAAELARETPSRWVPVFESLPRLMREPQWLLDRFERQMRRAGLPSDGLAAVLDRAGQEGRLLVLLDGLDEVPRDDRDDAEALLRQMSSRWPTTPILVTSRPIGFRRPGADFHELELLPLDGERRIEFLARWFGRATGTPDVQRAAKAAKGLEGDASLRELASNPLYLTLMALLIEQGASPAGNRSQLYDQVFDLLLDGKHRQSSRPIVAKLGVRQVLRHLAFEMTRANLDAEPVEQIEARLYKQELAKLREPLECVPRWRLSLRPFLDDLAEQTGILGEHDGPGTEWRFWHRTFREALAAEELARRHKAGGQEEILAHVRSIAGDESRWAEPFALLTGQINEPDALVKALVQENAALGLRALATAQTLADETIVEVLELSDDWQKRAEVFQALPDKLDDALRTLALVDRLRQRSRNGNDLFNLALVVSAVGERWPDAARQVDELRARFYDHIPPPPPELFEWVVTEDGRVPLWCEIPAGHFLMGSPDIEKGRYDSEGPAHMITLGEGFFMTAVPITQRHFSFFDPSHRSFNRQSNLANEEGQLPVESISWLEAISFSRWLSAHLARFKLVRLPYEDEWEYACRAGTQSRFWNGDTAEDLGRIAWYSTNSTDRSHPVGRKLANPWGLYDIHGNVLEWTLSPAIDYQQAAVIIQSRRPNQEMSGIDSHLDKVARGGSYWSLEIGARSAFRGIYPPELQLDGIGFRLVAFPH